jgi:hypothetical protein
MCPCIIMTEANDGICIKLSTDVLPREVTSHSHSFIRQCVVLLASRSCDNFCDGSGTSVHYIMSFTSTW